jgi:GNAT superfamily N-acetyltransferase
MKIEVLNRCTDFNSYRAARLKSLFNAESGAEFRLNADLPIDDDDWKIGLVVGPSGSGKTSIGRKIFGPDHFYEPEWESELPIVDEIAADGNFDDVTAALAGVGLGDIPAWLRPYRVLSNGEQFRADLARVLCEKPRRVVIDEFTSVIDRQIAKFGALAFQKGWRRTGGKVVLLSCHYDIIDWVEPDWIFDTATGTYSGRSLWRRPKFQLEIQQTNGSYWKFFEPHHYLKLPPMIAAAYYVGTVDGELVCHLGVSPRFEIPAFRACRLVVMPEWQGAGIGMRFLNAVCQMQLEGVNRYDRRLPTYFHTSHPALCSALRRDAKWRQCSASLYGGNKRDSNKSLTKSRRKAGKTFVGSGFGGHFRAVQGFKYVGAK